MVQKYSIKKGLQKGLISVLTIAVSLVTVAGLADVSIWDMIVKYVQPVVASLTVGGALTVALNALKFHYNK